MDEKLRFLEELNTLSKEELSQLLVKIEELISSGYNLGHLKERLLGIIDLTD